MMNKLQPKLKALQEMYGDDRQKLTEESQRLYKEAHYNPLSGCLPLLLQMPIFVALFQALQSIGTRVADDTAVTFFSLVPDLSASVSTVLPEQGILAAIPYIILVALFSLSIFVPTLLNGTKEKQTIIMMAVMAVFMLFVAIQSPGGVLLYWDVSAIIGIIIQFTMLRVYKNREKEEEAEEALVVPITVERKTKKARPTKKR